MNVNEAKAEVLRAGHELVEKGLVARTWGNASCRIDENRFAITPSGIAYDRLTEDNIVVVTIDTLAYEGKIKPSSEKGIHAAAYRTSPETNFVIHTHQACASAMSITGYAGGALTADEKELLGGEIVFSAYGLPGTKKLRRNVERVLKKKGAANKTDTACETGAAILMERHGALLVGSDRQLAFLRAVLLEEICRRSMSYSPGFDITPEKTVYSRRIPDGFILTQNGKESAYHGEDAIRGNTEMLHAVIYAVYPAFHFIAHYSSASVLAVMENAKIMPAMLDDFAQMVGTDVKIVRAQRENLTKAASLDAMNKLDGRNCVCVDGMGAVCCAGDETDCTALMMIIEKNALACVHAGKSGQVKPLPLLDRSLMRFVYTHKYAKMKR